MSATVPLATDAADAKAIEAIEQHHAELLGALTAGVAGLRAAVGGDAVATAAARAALVEWCERELVPHALAEEETLYPAAGAQESGRLLVAAMTDEHATIRGLVGEIATAEDAVRAAGLGEALRVLFDSHMRKENDRILPLLASAPGVSLSALLDGMHDELGGHDGGHAHDAAEHASSDAAHEPHACGCHEEETDLPELDARQVPHAIRHATVFGAVDALGAGQAMVLVAPHDPLPLLAQLEQRDPGAIAVDYLQRGPETWRLRLTRQP